MDISIYIQGAAIDRILGEIVRNKGMKSPIDYVLCAGHFLSKVCSISSPIVRLSRDSKGLDCA